MSRFLCTVLFSMTTMQQRTSNSFLLVCINRRQAESIIPAQFYFQNQGHNNSKLMFFFNMAIINIKIKTLIMGCLLESPQ